MLSTTLPGGEKEIFAPRILTHSSAWPRVQSETWGGLHLERAEGFFWGRIFAGGHKSGGEAKNQYQLDGIRTLFRLSTPHAPSVMAASVAAPRQECVAESSAFPMLRKTNPCAALRTHNAICHTLSHSLAHSPWWAQIPGKGEASVPPETPLPTPHNPKMKKKNSILTYKADPISGLSGSKAAFSR